MHKMSKRSLNCTCDTYYVRFHRRISTKGTESKNLQNIKKSFVTLSLFLEPGKNLRSGKKNFFVISPVLTKTYGERTFAHAAPIMWNNLPDSLRSLNSMEHFKSALKTYLFQLSLIS